MRSSIRTRLLAGYISVVLLLTLAWIVAAMGTNALRASYAHTVNTIDALTTSVVNLQKLAGDEEAGLRGYLLTRRPEFLEPYSAARQALPGVRAHVRALVATEPAVRSLLVPMYQRKLRWESWAAATLQHAADFAPLTSGSIVRQRIGKLLFDRYRAAAARVMRDLTVERLRDLRTSLAVLDSVTALFMLIFAGTIIVGGVLGWRAVHAVTRPLRLLEQAAAAIGHGELAQPIQIDGAREFKALAQRMDWMRRQLGSQRVTAEDQRIELLEQQQALENTAAALAYHAAEMERSNGDLEQFAYVASHDLQEPLRMVSSYMQLLSRRYKGKLDADADEFIGYAVDGATRMQTLINDLLVYSRVGTRGKEFAATDCDDAVSQALANLEVAIGERGARIVRETLPTIHGDSVQLIQLFQNLIGNALKFCHQTPQIAITAALADGEWFFTVEDNGIGIDPAYVERIFVIFQRLHTREEYAGTGIGLAICKKIVERHGGRIWVASQPGRGAAFTFTLPVLDGAARDAA